MKKLRIHDTAVIDEGAFLGSGVSVWHFSHICSGASIGSGTSIGQNCYIAPGVDIGSNVKIQNNVSIYTGTIVEDFVFLGPSCVLTNISNPRSEVNRRSVYERTVLKRGATVGANATIVCGNTLGQFSFVAAGAVVTGDTRDYSFMVGIPAKRKGWMSRHGHQLVDRQDQNGAMICPESGWRYTLTEAGDLRCLDYGEELDIPAELAQGLEGYREIGRLVSQDSPHNMPSSENR